ncbi:MAG: hypothetical protein U0003_04525 [Vampirovibrionales bacterium]
MPFSMRRFWGVWQASLLSVMAVGAVCNVMVWAQGIGPDNPADRPKPPVNPSATKVKEAFDKFFAKKEPLDPNAPIETEVVEVRKGAGIPGLGDTVKVVRQKQVKPADVLPEEETALVEDAIDSLENINAATGQSKTPAAPSRPPLIQQPPLQHAQVLPPQVSATNPPLKMPALDKPENPYGLVAAQNRLNRTALLIQEGKASEAKPEVLALKDWLTEATEAHIALYKALSKIPSAQVQSELEKQVALEFATMRDKAYYQLAKIHLVQNNPREATKLLVEVVKSQPGSPVGIESYEALQAMGFTQKLQLVED